MGSEPKKILSKMNHVLDESQLYELEELPGGQVVVIGGGGAGCEAALYLARHGAGVTILERKPYLLHLEQPMIRVAWQEQLKRAGVEVRTGVNCISLSADMVVAQDLDTQTKVEFPAESVVFATGGNRAISQAETFRNTAVSFAEVGACVKKVDLKTAVFDGFCAGAYI